MVFRHLLRPRPEAARLLAAVERAVGSEEVQLIHWLRDQARPEFRQRRVVILGAGVAGLACALELSRIGFAVVVLEAERSHVGGRVRTHRRRSNGRELHAELGAMRIPATHVLTNFYIDEFNLQRRPFVMKNDAAFLHLRGRSLRVGAVADDETVAMDLFALSEAERALGYGGLWGRIVLDVLESLSPEQKEQLFADRVTDRRLLELDEKALSTALHDARLSEEAGEYVMSMLGIEPALPIALTEHLREELTEVWLGKFYELEDGTDSLATAFHQALGSVELRQGCDVVRLEQPDGGSARVVYRDAGGGMQTEDGDWVICTIPLGVLNRLDIQQAFSKRKLRAIQGVNYDSSTKVIGHAPHRWWERSDGIHGGGTIWDTILGSTWYPADNVASDDDVTRNESLFLASYTWGHAARKMAAVPDAALDAVMRQELARVHTAVARQPELYSTEIRWAWDEVPTQAGAYAFFMPGEQSRLYADLATPDERIVLAGEHVSTTHSWIQGALESATRAMKLIVDAEAVA